MSAPVSANLAPSLSVGFPSSFPTLQPRQQGQSGIPSCARSCFDHFRSTGYSCDSNDLSCFCSRYSSHGLTLGELAYGCSHLECEDASSSQNKALYNICSGQSNAVTATHSTVTLPPYATSFASKVTTLSSATSDSSRITTTPSSQPASSFSTRISSHSEASRTDLPAESSDSATDTSPGPQAMTSEETTDLSKAQAVGVSIAAMGALCLAGALIYLLLWCKRRRAFKSPKARNGSFDFIDKGAPRHSPFRHGHADPRGPLGGFAKHRVELGDEEAQSQWQAQQNKVPSPDRGVRLVTQGSRSISPESQSQGHDSLRMVSQLLPDKAGATPPQPHYRSPRATSVFSTATIFEEDGKTPRLLSPATMLPMPIAPKPVLKSVPKRPERPLCSDVFSASPAEMESTQYAAYAPSRNLNKGLIPSPLKSHPPRPTPNGFLQPSGRPLSTEFRMSTNQHHKPPSSVLSYMPDYYTSEHSRSPPFAKTPNHTPFVPHRRPVPASVKPNHPTQPSKAYRRSCASDTSFESTDPDDLTPPEEENRQLSPVAESEDHVKYPKVPRSSNQAVPRSPQPTLSPSYHHSSVWPLEPPRTPTKPNPSTPPRQKPSLSGSTLAAKRRGSSAADSLSNGLHIKSTAHPQASPLKGYGRPANSIRGGRPHVSQRKPSYAGTGYGPDPELEDPLLPHTPEMRSPGPKILRTDKEVVLKSPLWEPKLTPSRRGEDLFLSVSLASPGIALGNDAHGMRVAA